MISDGHKFIFIHIPKTAGTSLCNIFLKEKAYIHTKKGRYYQSHVSVKDLEITNSDELDKYFTFSFVRNPWDIMVSWYKFRKCRNLSFDKFLTEYKIKNKYTYWLPETLYQTDFLLDENDNPLVDFIGRFENLQQDFNIICDKIGIPHQKLPHKNKTKHKHYTEYYDDETRQIVAEKFAKDIEYFGYEFGK